MQTPTESQYRELLALTPYAISVLVIYTLAILALIWVLTRPRYTFAVAVGA